MHSISQDSLAPGHSVLSDQQTRSFAEHLSRESARGDLYTEWTNGTHFGLPSTSVCVPALHMSSLFPCLLEGLKAGRGMCT